MKKLILGLCIAAAAGYFFWYVTYRKKEVRQVQLSELVFDSVPFSMISNAAIIDTGIHLELPGLDSLAVYRLFLEDVGEDVALGLQPNPVKDMIICATGQSIKNGKRVIVLDADNDGDLRDELFYPLDEQLTFIPLKNIEHRLGDSVAISTFYVKPYVNKDLIIFGGRNYRYPHEIRNLSFFTLPAYRFGRFKTDKSVYKVALCNYFRQEFNKEKALLCFVPERIDFPSPSHAPVYYKLNDIVDFDDEAYVFSGMSEDGSRVDFTKIFGHRKRQGVDSGLYAYPIVGNDLMTGYTYSLRESKSYTLLDFWGTWCGPCTELTPDLHQLYNDCARYNLQIVGIAFDRDTRSVKNYLERNSIKWINIFDEQTNSQIAEKYRVGVFPTFVLIDPDGKVIFRGTGKQGLQKVRSILMNGSI